MFNPVAKHMKKNVLVHKDKSKYSRKVKHKDKGPYA